MYLLTSGALPSLERHRHPNLGRLLVPGGDSRVKDTFVSGLPVAADNGCLNGLDAPEFMKMVRAIAALPSLSARIDRAWKTIGGAPDFGDDVRGHRHVSRVNPLFMWLAVPDVWGDSDTTLELFRQWHVLLCHLPLAFVLQDGAERRGWVPWAAPGLAAVFVGGTDRWRYGIEAAELVREARRRGLAAHFGRVSSRRMVRYVNSIGATSFDSSRYSRWRDLKLPEGLGYTLMPPNERLIP